MQKNASPETLSVHAGSEVASHHPSVVTPVYPASSYKYRGTTENTYPRYFNTVNQQVINEKLCALEGGEAGLVFSSGTAAISTTLFSLLGPGDHAVICRELYGGTYHMILSEFEKRGIAFSFTEDNSVEAFSKPINPKTRVIYAETPSNPLLSIIDLKAVGQLARSRGIVSIIDNTFASPINQNPLKLGFDVVVHSGTKYLGGHSDLCFGAVVTSKTVRDEIYKSAVNYGGSLHALDCYLIERSLKTLAVRIQHHNENALALARFLTEAPEVRRVYYPGLEEHPGHQIARSQMHGYGGMLSFELDTEDIAKLDAFLDNLQLIQPALSLGGVESIICVPAVTSHLKMPREERLKSGITDGLLRLSVGIESAADLIGDLKNALRQIKR